MKKQSSLTFYQCQNCGYEKEFFYTEQPYCPNCNQGMKQMQRPEVSQIKKQSAIELAANHIGIDAVSLNKKAEKHVEIRHLASAVKQQALEIAKLEEEIEGEWQR